MQVQEETKGPENYGKLGLHIIETSGAQATTWADPVYDRPRRKLNDDDG